MIAFAGINYHQYLQSKDWQIVRRFALESARYRCQFCNSKKRLQVHHRTYENLGFETLRDLCVCCRDCHKTNHEVRKLLAKIRRLRMLENVSEDEYVNHVREIDEMAIKWKLFLRDRRPEWRSKSLEGSWGDYDGLCMCCGTEGMLHNGKCVECAKTDLVFLASLRFRLLQHANAYRQAYLTRAA